MNLPEPLPYEGMGVTIHYWSDRKAGTIIQITHDGKRLVIQQDKAVRTDANGMSESQDYQYKRDLNGQIYLASLRKDGRYRISKSKQLVSLGIREEYYDFSF